MIVFLLALGLTLYPIISNYVNQKYASEIFTAYQEVIARTDNSVLVQEREKAIAYRVAEIKIIYPYEVDKILIQPGRELLTLLTCHPYASGGKQRYLVICERVYQEDNYG